MLGGDFPARRKKMSAVADVVCSSRKNDPYHRAKLLQSFNMSEEMLVLQPLETPEEEEKSVLLQPLKTYMGQYSNHMTSASLFFSFFGIFLFVF